MATPDEIRQRVLNALADKNLTPIEAATKARLSREYLRDFLKGRKDSIGKGALKLAPILGLKPADLLTETPTAPEPEQPPVIRRGAKIRLYITEHMENRGWDDAKLAGRIEDASPELVKSWRLEQWRMQWADVQAILHAFGMEEVSELARPPAPVTAPRKAGKQPSKTAPRRRA